MGSPVIGIKENILLFYKEIVVDEHHRYRSWEHCYSFFQKHRSASSEENIDAATLHLAFYLASWGMYRGSSQLLQRDYKVHTPIVQKLLEQKYSPLWRLDFDTVEKESPEVSLVIQLAQSLREIYAGLRVGPTDTLVTKVLLGTLGCIPAYDTLFVRGVNYWNHKLSSNFTPKFPAHFGIRSYRGLIEFYREHKRDFKKAQDSIAKRGIEYPIMKLADMYFWNLGYQTRVEKAQVLQRVARDLGDAFPGIDSNLDVSGGEPCIVRTRIPVWVLVQARQLGTSEADLLRSYPSLRAEDLANAWAFFRSHKKEIEQQIRENEEA